MPCLSPMEQLSKEDEHPPKECYKKDDLPPST